MSLLEYLRADPHCADLLTGAVLAVGPLLEEPDPVPVVALVDGWADALVGRMPLPWNLHGALDALNSYLFQEQGLQGDRTTYDDPANAVLPRVIARRKGIPIALAILWMEVARRLGFHAVGVALPGHFVCGVQLDLGTLYFDPFNAGAALGEEGAARLVALATGGRMAFHPSQLRPVSHRAILVRLVRNLHVRYMATAAWEEALWTATHLLLLAPVDSLALRDRAWVHFQRGEFPEGKADLEAAQGLGRELDPELLLWLENNRPG